MDLLSIEVATDDRRFRGAVRHPTAGGHRRPRSTPSRRPVRARHVGRLGVRVLGALLVPPVLAAPVQAQADAPQGLREEAISFQSEGERLHGTVIAPDEDGDYPAVVLQGGSGPETRDSNRKLAEEFARAGVVAFAYDKRTRGYSADPTGARSYSLLADDAAAAAERLRDVDYVDRDDIGVWGVSEGAWVAPLAANRSDVIAFVITMSGIGIRPASQVGWSVGRALEHQGITAASMHRALTVRIPRFIVSAEMMGEATYDPVPAIEQLRQPYLALWGEEDTVQPPFASARIIAAALERSGHRSHTLVVMEGTDHNGYPTRDGFARTSRDFTPGYVATMVDWIARVGGGDPPASSARPIPEISTPIPNVVDPRGYDTWYVQVASMAIFVFGFLGYLLLGAWRVVRRPDAPAPEPARWYARVLAAGGTVVWVYAFYYMFSVFIDSTADGSRDVASIVVAGRSGTWLVLQLASVMLVACGCLLAAGAWRRRHRIDRFEAVRLALVLIATIAFVPWAVHWQLLVP